MSSKKKVLIRKIVGFLVAMVFALLLFEGLFGEKMYAADNSFDVYVSHRTKESGEPVADVRINAITYSGFSIPTYENLNNSEGNAYYTLYVPDSISDSDPVEVTFEITYFKYKAIESVAGFTAVHDTSDASATRVYKVTATYGDWKSKSDSKTSPLKLVENDTFKIEIKCEANDNHGLTNGPYCQIGFDDEWGEKNNFTHDFWEKKDELILYKPVGDEIIEITLDSTSENSLADKINEYKVFDGNNALLTPVAGKYSITSTMVDNGNIKIYPLFKGDGEFVKQPGQSAMTDEDKNNLWFGPNQGKTLTFKLNVDGNFRYTVLDYDAPEVLDSMFMIDATRANATEDINVASTVVYPKSKNQIVRVYRLYNLDDTELLGKPFSVTVKYDATAPYIDGTAGNEEAYLIIPDGNGGEIKKKISELTTANPFYVSDTTKNDVKIRLYVKDADSGISEQSKYDSAWNIVTDNGTTYIEQPFTAAMVGGSTFTFYDDVKNPGSYVLPDITGKYLVDNTSPTASLSYSVEGEAGDAFTAAIPTTWKGSQVKIKIVPSDTESGVDKVTYKKGAGAEIEIAKNSSDEYILACEEGENTYYFYVYDKVGNKSTATYEATIKQKTSAIADASVTFSSGTEWNLELFYIQVSSKTISGFATVKYSFYEDGTATPVKTVTHTITEDNTFEDELLYPIELGNFKGKVVVTITDKAGKTKDIEKSFVYNKSVTDLEDFENYVANVESGATGELEIVLSGVTTVPASLLEAAKGKDVTLIFDLDNGVKWAVNGKDITGDVLENIDFSVTMGKDAGKTIPVDVINEITKELSSTKLTLAYDGDFGFKAVLSVNLEPKNSGYYANLFYYNPSSEKLEYVCAAKIDATGNVDFTFTHASDYVIVINNQDMKPAATPEDIPTGDLDNFPIWILLLAIASVLAIAGLTLGAIRKKYSL